MHEGINHKIRSSNKHLVYLVHLKPGTRSILILQYLYFQPSRLLLITAAVHCSFLNCMISRLDRTEKTDFK
jgi:hypothetical protein